VFVDTQSFEKVVSILKHRFRRVLPTHIRGDPFRTLVGCILSARTRDEFTDLAFDALFKKFESPKELAGASETELQRLIRPVNFYLTKARRIKQAAQFVMQNFGGRVPLDRVKLMEVPGIGPKCADVVLSYAFGVNTVAVDTHVDTVAKRLGVAAEEADYEEVKRSLVELAPSQNVSELNDLFVMFGKEICRKNHPKCYACPVYQFCEWRFKSTYKKRNSRLKQRSRKKKGAG
jgi:endonuclease-3